MKNLYLLILSSIIALGANAQLSGSYTIGGTAPDYLTVTQAVDSLNKKGVNGAVTFRIRSGNYNAQFIIGNVSGASATNTISFKPDLANTAPATIQYNNSTAADNYVIRFKSAKYVTFDSLVIGNISSAYATVISFMDTCQHITVSNSIIQGSAISPTSQNTILIRDENGTTNNSHNITFENNEILNGSYAFYIFGASSSVALQQDKWVIKNNRINGWGYYAIYSYYNKNIEIVNNTITSGNNVYAYARCVYMYFNGTPTVTGNTIYNGATLYGYGMYMSNCSGLSNNRNDISNNSIHVRAAQYGVYFSGCNYSDFYFNTVRIDGGNSTATTAAYLNLTSNSNFKNNILVNMGLNNTSVMNSVGTSLLPDYNNYYSPSKPAAVVGTNSMSVDPMFVSPTDLHIKNVQLNGKALTIAGITKDIDGETRNTATDIGADEFDPDTLDAAALKLKSIYCAGTNNIEFTVLNFGIDTIKTIKIRFGISVNGRPFQYQFTNYTGNLPSGNTAIVNLLNYNFLADTAYRLTARIDSVNGVPDTFLTNNSLLTPTFGSALSGEYTIGGTTPDFLTFTSAVSNLTTSGVCGPVKFKVRSGLYNESIIIAGIKGVNSTDTVLFIADSGVTQLPVLYSANARTITFNGTSQVTFRNLEIHNNNRYGYTVELNGSNSYISFDSCMVRADTLNNTFSSSMVFNNNSNSPLSHFSITNSDLRGGRYSVNMFGTNTSSRDSSLELVNNNIHDWGQYGLRLYYQQGPKVMSNILNDKDQSTAKYGMYLYYNYDGDFSSNQIYFSHATGGYGTYSYLFQGSSVNSRAKFYNNVVSNYSVNSSMAYTIYAQSMRYTDFVHNSIYSLGISSTARCVYLASPTGVIFRNNVIFSKGPGTAYYIIGTSPTFTHNNIYTEGGVVSNVPVVGTNISINPNFLSPKDLHVKSIFVNSSGLKLGGYDFDFEGDARANPSDMGADEFDVDSNDVGVARLILPISGGCGIDSQKVKILIFNNGFKSQNSLSVGVKVSGPVNTTLTGTYSGTLNSSKYDTVFVGYLNTAVGGRFDFKMWTALSTDTYEGNDTLLTEDVLIDRIPKAQNQGNIVVCEGIDTTIYSGYPAKTVKWYDAAVNGNLIHEGDSMKVNLNSATTYYVTGSDDYTADLGIKSATANALTLAGLQGLKFDAVRPFVIDSVTVYPVDSGGLVFELRDENNTLIVQKTISVVPQLGSRVHLGFNVPPGKDYLLMTNSTATNGLLYENFANFPYRDVDSSMVIKSEASGGTRFYVYMYDVQISVEGCDGDLASIPVNVRPTPPLDLGNDTGYCTGTTINLIANANATGAGSFRWDNNSSSATRTLTTSGSYSVTVTASNGCVISDTIKIDEIPQPTMSWVDRRYCDNAGTVKLYSGVKYGGTYTGTGIVNGTHLNTSIGAGTYNLNYTYSDGMGCFGQASGAVYIDASPVTSLPPIADLCQSRTPKTLTNGSPSTGYFFDNEDLIGFGTYLPKFAGLDTIFYVGYSNNGCKDTAFATVNVKASPQPVISSIDTICENESPITVSATPAGGQFSGVGLTGSSFDPSVTGSGKHPVYYEAWNAQGCTTKVGKNILVLEKPNLVFDLLLDVCEKTGPYLIKQGFPSGGVFSGTFVNTVTNVFDVDAAGVGTYPINYKITGANGCSNDSTNNLIVKPIPNLDLGGNKEICGKHTVTLDAGNPGALYLWNTNATSQTIVVSRDGKYKVFVDLNGCETSDSVEVFYEASCVGIKEIDEESGIAVYPNPVKDILNVSFDHKLTNDLIMIAIIDAQGKEIYNENTEGIELLNIDMSRFNSGLYFIQIEINGDHYQSKFSVLK